METLVDTIENINTATMQDELTPEQRTYWQESIARDMNNMNQPKKYISLEQFGKELLASLK